MPAIERSFTLSAQTRDNSDRKFEKFIRKISPLLYLGLLAALIGTTASFFRTTAPLGGAIVQSYGNAPVDKMIEGIPIKIGRGMGEGISTGTEIANNLLNYLPLLVGPLLIILIFVLSRNSVIKQANTKSIWKRSTPGKWSN